MSEQQTTPPKVGETVYVRYNDTSSEVVETTVEKVGRKYFTLKSDGWWPLEFDIETPNPGYWRASTRARHSRVCYRDEAVLKAKIAADELERERGKLRDEMRKAFDSWGRTPYTLDQLRRIKAIVDEAIQACAGKKGGG